MDEADEGLIRFLMRDRHGTPFEHNAFRFHVRCPIFVAREWFRHRIGSFNEFSLRYAKATDDFYVPAAEDVRSQVGKPGAYTFEPVGARAGRADAGGARGRLRARVRDLRATRRGRRRARARPVGPPGRGLHTVLLDAQRASTDEFRLAPELDVRAARNPTVRGSGRNLSRREDARHPRCVRRKRPRRAVAASRLLFKVRVQFIRILNLLSRNYPYSLGDGRNASGASAV